MNAVMPAASSRYLTFEVDAQLYALRAAEVAEVIRMPTLARVPQAPPALLGVANLRGSVLPVASLRVMLGNTTGEATSACAIVLDAGAPVAIVVDTVATLESAEAGRIETEGGGEAAHLLGAFAIAGTQKVARVLDIRLLLDAAFALRARANPQQHARDAGMRSRRQVETQGNTEMLVTFEVAGQEFALPLAAVQEILPAPAGITAVVRAEAAVLGIISVRDRLLPLLSLRSLLGFPASSSGEDRQKVVVLKVGDAQVGLVADRARAIVAAHSSRVDAVPPVLAARTGGESRIRSVYRGEDGQRLISILSPEHLFRNDVMQRLNEDQRSAAAPDAPDQATEHELICLVFRLGNDEFGLPIEAVVEVAQVPDQITRVPRTPKFLEGVVNFRGEVLPIVDQRRRFDMPPLDHSVQRRLVVIRNANHRAGLIVDSVSDVLRTRESRIEPPPDLTEATARLIRGVLNLEEMQRIVLLLDPAELLTRAEQGLLDTFQASRKKADA